MKLLTVIGARPQFIKSAAMTHAIREHTISQNIQDVVIHTGQHYDHNMSDIFFNQMGLKKPDYQFNIPHRTHGAMTGDMIKQIETILIQESPDIVVVYGDTNSTVAGAIAASKLHIPIAHVEAGLRSFNKQMPEETNRVLTDIISTFCFCPSEQAITNLKKEGIIHSSSTIVENIGDVMYDVSLMFQKKATLNNSILALLTKQNINLNHPYVLATVHRAENTDAQDRLAGIMRALDDISQTMPVLLPLHPRTKKQLDTFNIKPEHIVFLPPLSYLDMMALMTNCECVMTDSGGLQKEAYFLNKYCITLRDETEWVELVDHGANILAGAHLKQILKSFYERPSKLNSTKQLYGDGQAAKKIVSRLLEWTRNRHENLTR